MYHINFDKPIKVHFIGIGGISMSGLAELLHTIGFTVSGTDGKESQITKHLSSLGIKVMYGQRASNISDDLDLVVYTSAVKESNEEYQEVLKRNIPIIDRAELIGQVMLNYKEAIAISGTHGKTTTTSMISLILLEANLDPTITVGGILKDIKGNLKIGAGDCFVTEACEYTNSFLKFNPTRAIILNVESDHLDFFKDLEDIRHSFKAFTNRLPKQGLLIINGDIEELDYFTTNLPCDFVTYSVEQIEPVISSAKKHYGACNITYNQFGNGSYDLYENGTYLTKIELSVVGNHNISNSLPAIALALSLGIDIETIKRALYSFKGTDRRFQYKGEIGGVTIVDDYAHHPTEVTATLTAAKNVNHNNLWCVFQPHTYTRTKSFLKEFACSLSLADKIILSDIYAAREVNTLEISSNDLYEELLHLGKEVYYMKSFDEIENFLLQHCTNGDLLITMGAGDIVTIGESLLGE